ncbi:Sodium/hydrogen exchanger 2 [Zea mays]|uniref:Sodium/hydrogen exchanger 2 n=1 Tax=Zea mays TaxID=4577 RepID=A0A1D6JUG6_MAIZE|nr:Sodium/hydrogen exchanger 2 [Zea mays]ONL95429.1 Sodium/hydrogen exchanger 2 [Zea mays]ONL95430.1 Sodium/hydrogen exchanger 2 [Zea mays]ONL95432.1 Sodium/hydrogen exchanger 2 [Zea mays]ONL95433.1 Sodium/hydrogen exchanger 2 [Zea mays]
MRAGAGPDAGPDAWRRRRPGRLLGRQAVGPIRDGLSALDAGALRRAQGLAAGVSPHARRWRPAPHARAPPPHPAGRHGSRRAGISRITPCGDLADHAGRGSRPSLIRSLGPYQSDSQKWRLGDRSGGGGDDGGAEVRLESGDTEKDQSFSFYFVG